MEPTATAYSYDLRSRLTSMTSTLYGQNLRYTPGGNIASMTWSAGSGRPQRSYEFGYDGLSRLTCARYDDSSGGKGKFDTSYTYDLNGNITALTRKGDMSPFSAGRYLRPVTIDSLTLEYSGNRLIRVTDAATGPFHQGVFHFIDGADEPVEYLYDDNGNTVRDINRGIVASHFDFNNRPRMLEFADGSSTAYLYDDTGTKLRTIHHVATVPVAIPGSEGAAGFSRHATSGLSGSSGDMSAEADTPVAASAITETVTDYCRGIIYEDGEISRINLDGGYLSYTDPAGNRLTEPQYHFYLHDHLGNNRADVSASGLVCQQTDYYPYGLPMSSSANTSYQRWLFGGKEMDRISGLDLYDQEARAYDPTLGRFRSVDSYAEKYNDLTPYLFCAANPLRNIDPTGLYTLENQGSRLISPVVCVCPVLPPISYNESKETRILRKDYKATKKSGVPIIQVENVADLNKALTDYPLSDGTLTVVISSHGSPGSFSIGSENIIDAEQLSILGDALKDKEVIIKACDVAGAPDDEKSASYIEDLAKVTGATVIASEHSVTAGYKYDGSLGLSATTPIIAPDTFKMSVKGEPSVQIRDLTINKYFGTNWKNK